MVVSWIITLFHVIIVKKYKILEAAWLFLFTSKNNILVIQGCSLFRVNKLQQENNVDEV